MTRFETIAAEEKSFRRWLAEIQSDVLEPESLVPASDRSVFFTNSAVTSFKPYLAGALELPNTSVAVVQPCVRVQNLSETFHPDFNGDFVLTFVMFGAMTSKVHAEEFTANIHRYLGSVVRSHDTEILFKAHPNDHALVGLWMSAGGVRSSLLLGTESDAYYRWRFGLSDVSGCGATFAVRQSNGRIRDLGNLMEFRRNDQVIGYGFGFGVETLVACKKAARWVIDCVPIAEILPISNEQEAKCADLVALVTTLIHGGITLGRKRQSFVLRKALSQLIVLSKRVGWDMDAVAESMNQLEQTMWGTPSAPVQPVGTIATRWAEAANEVIPPVREQFDLSFFVPEGVSPERVAECVRRLTNCGIDNVEVFDVYRGNVSIGTIGVGIRVRHTLIVSSKQVMIASVNAVTAQLGGRIRGAV